MSNAKVQSAAAQWLVDLESADYIEQLWPAFQAWLAKDPRHRAAFERMEEAARHLDALQYLRPIGEAVNPDLLSDLLCDTWDASELSRDPGVNRCIRSARWGLGTASQPCSIVRAALKGRRRSWPEATAGRRAHRPERVICVQSVRNSR